MTQEEKAKRYDEVFNAAKEWYNNPNSSNIGKSYLYAVFPELKENEDERIRLAMIKGLSSCGKKYWGGFEVKAAIAWLEKQGEQKLSMEGTFVNVDDVREDFIQEVYRVLDADSTNDRANQIIDAFDNLPTVTIKQDPCEHCEHKYLNCHNFPCDEKKTFEQGKSALEAINEEKVDNANKVDPKFHEGDCIVNRFGDVWHIDSVDKKNYQVSDGKGNYNYFPISKQDEMHLYTIEDAKAGDVIYSRHNTESFEWIGIFKSLDKENKGVHFYGFWNNVTKTFKVCGNGLFVSYDDFSPATKEQCDTLEKAMADAGYTFDFEKKELKKIDDDKVVIKKGEKPTEWSENDDIMLYSIIDFFENRTETLPYNVFTYIPWLKSLRNKVNCKANCATTKKWSEEDIATISRVISIVKWAAYSDHSHPILNDEGATELVERLKSLKDRYTWKPSDEQMDALQYVYRNLNPPLSDKLWWDSTKTLELLYQDLKKL